MKKALKNLFALTMGLLLFPFTAIIGLCAVPLLLHSLVMRTVHLNLREPDAWWINKALEGVISIFLTPFDN